MTNKEAIAELKAMPIIYPITNGENDRASRLMQARDMAIKALEQSSYNSIKSELKGDMISRQAVLDITWEEPSYTDPLNVLTEVRDKVKDLPSVNPQPKTEQFVKWVATEIFDENWEYNKDAFAELACRKLAKLGIVKANGDTWELVEPQERSSEE